MTTNPAATWTAVNPYLAPLEMGVETESPNKAKINFSQHDRVRWNSLDYWNPSGVTGGGGGAWGDITGTLSDQTDLQDALDDKADAADLPPFTAASASGPAALEFAEDTDNGTNKVTLKAPATLGSDIDVVLPDTAGALALESGVKVYAATLTQSGTSAPVATVLENSLGGTVVWTRDDVGAYSGTLTDAFTSGKTLAGHTLYNGGGDALLTLQLATTSTVAVSSLGGVLFDTPAPADDLLNDFPVYITVYP